MAESGPSFGIVCVMPVPWSLQNTDEPLSQTIELYANYSQHCTPNLIHVYIHVYQCDISSSKAKLHAPTSLYFVVQERPQISPYHHFIIVVVYHG